MTSFKKRTSRVEKPMQNAWCIRSVGSPMNIPCIACHHVRRTVVATPIETQGSSAEQLPVRLQFSAWGNGRHVELDYLTIYELNEMRIVITLQADGNPFVCLFFLRRLTKFFFLRRHRARAHLN